MFQFSLSFPISTPVSRANIKNSASQRDPSLKDEIGEVEKEEEEEEGETKEKHKENEERGGEEREDKDAEEGGGVEPEQRNTDSVFSELFELSHDYVASVDQGASVRGELRRRPPVAAVSICLE